MGKPQPQNPSVAKIPAHLVQAVARKMEVELLFLNFGANFSVWAGLFAVRNSCLQLLCCVQ
jgi:hypothetical protein